MSDYFERIERQLLRSVESRAPRRVRWPARVVPVAAALLVVAVVAVFLGVSGRSRPTAGTARGGSVVFASSAPAAQLDRAAQILRLRLGAMYSGVHVARAGHDIAASADGASRAQIEALAAPGRLTMYDWEANALTPTGRTVASQLAAETPVAMEISQGSGGGFPGSAGGGALPLYEAVLLAERLGRTMGAQYSQYYFFRACAHRQHCLVAGPAPTESELLAQVPLGVGGQESAVSRGIVVLEAAAPSFGRALAVSNPAARFFVLRDRPALTGSDITAPHVGRDAGGRPDVQFGFTAAGARAFRAITAGVAKRGSSVSGLGLTLNQHFAVALDGRLLTVPSIDFRTYPEGLAGKDGADLDAGFTRQSAGEVAALLRYGPLPAELRAL